MKKLGLRAIFRYFFRSSFPSNRQSASFHSSLIGAARPAVISNPTMTVWQTPFICPVSVLTICCNNLKLRFPISTVQVCTAMGSPG